MTDIFLQGGELSPNDIRLGGTGADARVGTENNSTDVAAQVVAASRKAVVGLLITASAGLFLAPAPLPPTSAPNGWHVPLSPAPAVAQPQPGLSFVPFNTRQITAAAGIPLHMGGAAIRARQVYYQAQFNPPPPPVPAAVNYTNLGWYAPLSPAPAVAQARQGDSFVPFNTAQLVVAPTEIGIPLFAGGAPPRVRQVYYQSRFETHYQTPVVVAAAEGWQAPLSGAPPVAKAVQGDSFVPFNTVQRAQPLGIFLDPGNAAPRLRRTYYQGRFNPPYVVSVVAAYVPSLDWQQPLAQLAPLPAPAPVGFSFVPFNTAQVIPPVVPPVEPPPDELGGTTSTGGGGGFCRKKWKKLLDEIRAQLAAEQAALKAAKKHDADINYAAHAAKVAAIRDRVLGLVSGCAPEATISINRLLDRVAKVEASYQDALAREEDDEEVILVMLHS